MTFRDISQILRLFSFSRFGDEVGRLLISQCHASHTELTLMCCWSVTQQFLTVQMDSGGAGLVVNINNKVMIRFIQSFEKSNMTEYIIQVSTGYLGNVPISRQILDSPNHYHDYVYWMLIRAITTLIVTSSGRLQSAFPKVHCSEGSLFRRSIVPKKRFIVPKVHWSEGSFIRNRGLLLRRFIVPK